MTLFDRNNFPRFKGAGLILRQYRKESDLEIPWLIRKVPVCTSTENLIATWSDCLSGCNKIPLALIAERQNYGFGQHGRSWSSPRGGVWISTAFPPLKGVYSNQIINLAVALCLSECLEKKGINAAIKWPNDIYYDDRKLAGILTRLIYRGTSLRLVRVGIGLNVLNKVPVEGISLKQVCKESNLSIEFWSAQVLLALDKLYYFSSKPDLIISEVERRLWSGQIKDIETGELWSVDGLEKDGSIRLINGHNTKLMKH